MVTADIVGVVRGVAGVVTARGSDGSIRTLKAGDPVFAGEMVHAGKGATAHIDFTRGGFATLGSEQSLELDSSLLAQAAEAAQVTGDRTLSETVAAAPDISSEILLEQIQDAIARGEDPTDLLEAAAAGVTPADTDEGAGFVIIQQNAARGELTPGFETDTSGIPVDTAPLYEGAPGFAPAISIVPIRPDAPMPPGVEPTPDPAPTPAPVPVPGPDPAPVPAPTPDPVPTPDAPASTIEIEGYNLVINEAYLEGGTEFDPERGEPVYGMQYLITSNEGLAFVGIDGVQYQVSANGTLVGFDRVYGNNGSLSDAQVTDNGNGTWTLSFLYQQGSAVQHAEGADRNVAGSVDSFSITVHSGKGAYSSLIVHVDIIDDVPVAHSQAVAVEEGYDSVTGDVLDSGQIYGADGSHPVTPFTWGEAEIELHDGTVIPLTLDGNILKGVTESGTVNIYGHLDLHEDGTFTYTKAGGNEPFEGVVKVGFTIMDADGDTAHATLGIYVNDQGVTISPPAPFDSGVTGFDLSVDEAGLGSDGEVWSEPRVMHFTVEDGFGSAGIGGVLLTDGQTASIVGQYGTLMATLTLAEDGKSGSIEYSYRLETAVFHETGDGKNTQIVTGPESFSLVVTDRDGDRATTAIGVTVIDDVPIAFNDVRTLSETGLENTWISGNVVSAGTETQGQNVRGDTGQDTSDASGADGFDHVSWNTGPKNGYTFTHDGDNTYTITDASGKSPGTISLNSDGSYRFDLDPDYDIAQGGEVAPLSLAYTLYDRDGDQSTASLIINLASDTHVPAISLAAMDSTVSESGLAAGTAPDAQTTGSGGVIEIGSTEALKAISIAGFEMHSDDGQGDFSGSAGAVIYVDASGSSVDPQTHRAYTADDTAVAGAIEITDIAYTEGEGYAIEFTFTLLNPIAGGSGDVNTVDRPAGESGVHSISIAVVAVDQTGDEVEGSLFINVLDDAPLARPDAVTILETGDAITVVGNVIDGSVNIDGSVAGRASALGGADSFGADGAGSLEWSGLPITHGGLSVHEAGTGIWHVFNSSDTAFANPLGTLTLTTDGQYKFVQIGDVYRADGGGSIEIGYAITDSDGDRATSTLTINIIPDQKVPTFSGGSAMSVHESALSGARGEGEAPGTGTGSFSTKGTLTINTYSGDSGRREALDEVTVRGSSAGANFERTFTGENGVFTLPAGGEKVYVNVAGQEVSMEDPACIGYLSFNSILTSGTGTSQGYTVSYTFTLTDNVSSFTSANKVTTTATGSPLGSTASGVDSFTFKVTATDHTGDTATSNNIKVNVYDDAPFSVNDSSAFNEQTSVIEGDGRLVTDGKIVLDEVQYDRGTVGNVLDNDRSGADGWSGSGWTYGSDGKASGGDGALLSYKFSMEGGTGNYSIEGKAAGATLSVGEIYTILHDGLQVGKFVMYGDGAYAFVKPDGATGINENVRFVFSYTVADADGDRATAHLELDISNPPLVMFISGDKVVYEEKLFGEYDTQGDPGADGHYTIASYKIDWAGTEGGNVVRHEGTSFFAGESYSFDVSYRSEGATYGEDAVFIIGGTDDARAGQAGSTALMSAADVSAYESALNAQLLATYGTDEAGQPFVSAHVTWAEGAASPVIAFHVKDGCDLSKGAIELGVKAMDDSLTENPAQSYTLVMSNIHDVEGTVSGSISIVSDPDGSGGVGSVTTVIKDGGNTGWGSGKWLAVEESFAQESETDVTLGVRLYNNLYENDLGEVDPGSIYVGREHPAETMHLTFGYSSGTATPGVDYEPTANSAAIASTDWSAFDAAGNRVIFYDAGTAGWVDTGGDIAYWHADATIKGLLIDDAITELDETFGIYIEGVTGNESAPLMNVLVDSEGRILELGDNISDGMITVRDDVTVDQLEGPGLVSFGLTGQLIEPAAVDVDGGEGNEYAARSQGHYLLTLDSVASEDIVVSLELGGNALLGKDFAIGEDSALLTWAGLQDYFKGEIPFYVTPVFDADGNIDGSVFYLVIQQGSASAGFSVDVLHNHQSRGEGAGTISWTIGDMAGSEVRWAPDGSNYEKALLTTSDIIQDDNQGPVVTMELDSVSFRNVDGEPTFTIAGEVGLQTKVAMGEEVGVYIKATSYVGGVGTSYIYVGPEMVIGADGSPVALNVLLKASDFKELVTGEDGLPDWEAMRSSDRTLPTGGIVYLAIDHTLGGETRFDGTPSDPIHFSADDGRGVVISVGVPVDTVLEKSGEAGSSSVSYDVHVEGLSGVSFTRPVSITIDVYDVTTSPDDFIGQDRSVTLSLDPVLLTSLQDAGVEGFTMELRPDADGHPVLILKVDQSAYTYDLDTNAFTDGSTSFDAGKTQTIGQLPTVYDDGLIEGDQFFSPVITDVSGPATPTGLTSVVTVKDSPDAISLDVRVGLVDPDGEFRVITDVREGDLTAGVFQPGMEGSEMVVRVSLPAGIAIEGKDSVRVLLEAAGDAADRIILHAQEVVIGAGQTYVDVRVTFPNDSISQPELESFTVRATIQENPYGATGMGESASVLIHEVVDGPVMSLLFPFADGKTVRTVDESGSAQFMIRLDKVVAEDATAKVQLAFDSLDGSETGIDPVTGKSSMTPSDIKSITVDGIEYAVVADGAAYRLVSGAGELPFTVDTASHAWILDVPIHKGTGMSTFTVTLDNDRISEATEILEVQIIGAKGGELQTGEASSLALAVTDLPDGPVISLAAAAQAVQEGSELAFTLTLAKNAVPADEASNVTLKLAGGVDSSGNEVDWKAWTRTDDTGHYVEIDFGGGSDRFYLAADGTVTITIPSGTAVGTYVITIPTNDNVLADADRPVSLVIADVSGGEASLAYAGSARYALVSQDGSGSSFVISANSTSFAANAAVVRFFLDGINESNVAATTVRLGGVVHEIQGPSGGRYYVEAHYDAGESIDRSIRIDGGDYTRDISITTDVSLKAVVTIVDNLDGPVISIASESVTSVEGSGFVFSFAGSELPAVAEASADAGVLASSLSVTILLAVTQPVAIAGEVTVDEASSARGVVLEDNGDGTVGIFIPAGMSEADIGSITVSVPLADNAIAREGGISATVVKVIQDAGGGMQYEAVHIGEQASVVHVVANNPDGSLNPSIALAVSDVSVDGGSSFTVAVAETTGILAGQGTDETAVNVLVHFDGLPQDTQVLLGDLLLMPDADGNYAVVLTKASDQVELMVSLPDGVDVAGAISVTIAHVEDGGYFEKVEVIADAPVTVLLSDPGSDGFDLSIRSQPDIAANEMAYVIALSPSGLQSSPEGSDQTIGHEIAFSLDVHGKSADQISSVIEQLNETSDVAAVLGEAGDSIDVTLGSAYEHTSSISFSLGFDGFEGENLVMVRIDPSSVESAHGNVSVDPELGHAQDSIIVAAPEGGELFGSVGNDIIIGGPGDDIIFGAEGDDIIYGGAGDNIITGGGGNDTFVYTLDSLEGKEMGDVIRDFSVGKVGEDADADILDMSDILSGMGKSGATLTELIDQGYLSIDVTDEGNGNAKMSVGVDLDASPGNDDTQVLVTLLMSGVSYDPDSAHGFEQQVFDQLVNNDQIKL